MSNGQENNKKCELHKFEKNNYFYGKLMTVRDFETEQSYINEKRHLINRLVHGSGLVCGLSGENIKISSDEGGKIKIKFLDGGVALDCCGNEIVIESNIEKNIFLDTDQKKNFTVSDITADNYRYIYLRYKECPGEMVSAASNPSSCEDACCVNRIKEDFDVVASPDAPAAVTLCSDIKEIISGSASGDEAKTQIKDLIKSANQTCPECTDAKVFLVAIKDDLSIDPETGNYIVPIYNNKLLSELLTCHVLDFNNPHKTTAEQVKALKTINGVGNADENRYVSNVNLDSDGTIEIDPDVDADKITIKTIPAISVTSVEKTKNVGTSKKFARQDHVHDLADGVVTTPKIEDGAVTTPKIEDGAVNGDKLASDAVERKHLNIDVINNLLDHDDTITITPDNGSKTIKIQANPSSTVSSVGKESDKTAGSSPEFARGDHVHDLADGVVATPKIEDGAVTTPKIEDGAVNGDKLASDAVERKHLNSDIINNLLTSDGTIEINPDDGSKQIAIRTNPAKSVTSVGQTKVVGKSKSFAHEDHVHDLDTDVVNRKHLNGDVIESILSSDDESITIEPDVPNKKINLRTAQRAGGTTTGVVIFPSGPSGYGREAISGWIDPQLGEGPICVILGLEQGRHEPIFIGPIEYFQAFHFPSVLLGAVVDPRSGKFQVGFINQGETPDVVSTDAGSIRVRWWAFKPGNDLGEVTVISVSIDPIEATLQLGNKLRFTAIITGSEDTSVVWEVEETGGGTIDKTGLYTAPGTPGTYHVVATSKADPTKSARATVVVISEVSISIKPSEVELVTGEEEPFTAEVTGSANIGVIWSMQETDGGIIKGEGPNSATYIAPQKPGIYHVVATSSADTSKSAMATVTVIEAAVKYVAYTVFSEKKLIVENGLCENGEKNCMKLETPYGVISGGGYYGMVGKRAALNGQPDKLTDLLIAQSASTSEKRTLTVGESWDVGGGWSITAVSIDAKANPRQVWLMLSYNGAKVEDRVLAQGQVYTYVEKSIADERDVPMFVTYVDSIFAGATSDMVQLRFTWAISRNVKIVYPVM